MLGSTCSPALLRQTGRQAGQVTQQSRLPFWNLLQLLFMGYTSCSFPFVCLFKGRLNNLTQHHPTENRMNLEPFFFLLCGDNEVNKRPCLLPTSQVCLLSAFSGSNHLASEFALLTSSVGGSQWIPQPIPSRSLPCERNNKPEPSLWIMWVIHLSCHCVYLLHVYLSGLDFYFESDSQVDLCTWVSQRKPR